MNALRTIVLDEDRELARVIDQARNDNARGASAASVVQIPPGPWEAMENAPHVRGGYGLLVLEGLLIRRVGLDGRFGAEVLGPFDLLRPWESDGESSGSLPFEASWRVMAPLRLAVLDIAWATRMAPYP